MADPGLDDRTVGSQEGFAAARYQTGFADREPYLVRARRISKLTIPSLFREWGATGITDEVLPWQSNGAACVNNLNARTVQSLYPTGIPFINIKPSREALKASLQLPSDQRGALKAALDKALSAEEMAFIEAFEEDGNRAVLYDAGKHMIVGGNHALCIPEEGTIVGFPLEQYVVWRDRAGNLTEFCIEDPMSFDSMPEDVKVIVVQAGYGPTEQAEGDHHGDTHYPGSNWDCRNPLWAPINVYTYGKRIGGKWRVFTEVMGEEVPGSNHPYSDETLPYLFLRMVAQKKEAYGRSYCEDYEADLQTYDAIWQAITEGGALLARMITVIKAGGTTNKEQYAKAANGAVITGSEDEVAIIRSDKGGDMQIILSEAEQIEARLKRVFLMESSVVRQGERVTATEIQSGIRELETLLGGMYSNQVTTQQRPLAVLLIARYMREDRMTKLPKGQTKITILTGDAALGRMRKAQALEEFLQVMGEIFGEDAMAKWINVGTVMEKSAANRAVDSDGVVKDAQTVQQEEQQQQQAALAQQVAPNVADAAGKIVTQSQAAALAGTQGAGPQATPQPQGAPAQ